MLFKRFLILLCLPFCFSKSVDVTFKRVTFRGYSIFKEIYNGTITSGNRLKDFLPNFINDAVEIKYETISIIYKDSLADLGNLYELSIEFCHIEEIRPGAISNSSMLRKLSFKGKNLLIFQYYHINHIDKKKIIH